MHWLASGEIEVEQRREGKYFAYCRYLPVGMVCHLKRGGVLGYLASVWRSRREWRVGRRGERVGVGRWRQDKTYPPGTDVPPWAFGVGGVGYLILSVTHSQL